MNVAGKQIKVEGRLLKIARLDADKHESLQNPDSFIRELHQVGARIDLFTFLQELPDSTPAYTYPLEWDNLAVLRVSTFENWWTKQVDAKTRNMVRKAEKKGVTLREVAFDDCLMRGIWNIYNEVPMRQGKPFPHFGKNLDAVCKESGTYLDRSVFIGAFLDHELIGFIKLVVDDPGTRASVMNIVSLVQHRDKAPTNALVAHAVRVCADRKIPFLVYSNFSYGKKLQDSLSDFKKNNGFEKIDLPRYYVPLTTLGRVGFGLGLHKKFVDLFPESLMSKLRELRQEWYSHKFRSAAEAS